MNKLTKLLSIFVISGAIGAGVAGVVGCGGNSHTSHTWRYTDNDNGTHSATCTGCSKTIDSELHVDDDGDRICDICENSLDTLATYELIPDKIENKIYPANYSPAPLFTILAGTEVRARSRLDYSVYDSENGNYKESDAAPVATGFSTLSSIKLGGSGQGFSVEANYPGKLTLYIDNGSSGTLNQLITLTSPDGKSRNIMYYGVGMYAITIDCDTAGTYKITRGGGTSDVYYAKYEALVEVTPIEKIEVAEKGVADYIPGQQLNPEQLEINVVHQTTNMIRTVGFEDVKIDASDYDATRSGVYPIHVKYTDKSGNQFTTDYDVTVYEIQSISLNKDMIVKEADTRVGNSVYANHHLRELYFVGDTVSDDGMSVTVSASYEGTPKDFIVTDGYTLSGADFSSTGKKTVTVTMNAKNVSATFEVYVINKPDVSGLQTVKTVVDGAFTDAQIGVQNGGEYQFRTVHQAIEFLEALGLDDDVAKEIRLAAGTFTEKLEITLPNLTITGAGTGETGFSMIEWDALVGDADPSGFIHVTDSCSTLNIRETAVGFTIKNVIISNWYNSEEHFTEAKGAGYGEHRALAMLIQADKVVIDSCRLLGYQDTIEFFKGRQLVINTYIAGRTDFIFGSNNTTYFYNCEIHSIVDGGYVTAFKGNNKDASDAVLYGAIFDNCNFTAPDSVIAKNTALGRTWGAYPAVAFMNSNIGGHVTKLPSTGSTAGERYVSMSGNMPTDPTVHYVEYGNEGEGAISASQAGVTVLDAEQAANYSDLSVVFGKTNGGVSYDDVWEVELSDYING